jgi:hypothetical protein
MSSLRRSTRSGLDACGAASGIAARASRSTGTPVRGDLRRHCPAPTQERKYSTTDRTLPSSELTASMVKCSASGETYASLIRST